MGKEIGGQHLRRCHLRNKFQELAEQGKRVSGDIKTVLFQLSLREDHWQFFKNTLSQDTKANPYGPSLSGA